VYLTQGDLMVAPVGRGTKASGPQAVKGLAESPRHVKLAADIAALKKEVKELKGYTPQTGAKRKALNEELRRLEAELKTLTRAEKEIEPIRQFREEMLKSAPAAAQSTGENVVALLDAEQKQAGAQCEKALADLQKLDNKPGATDVERTTALEALQRAMQRLDSLGNAREILRQMGAPTSKYDEMKRLSNNMRA
jgi:septal ring factor EnvC (AmiA/AmiB activator)